VQKFTYTILEDFGIHARPAGLLVKLAKSFPDTTVTITNAGITVKATQIIKLMNMGVTLGDVVTVTATGAAEKEAIAAFQTFFEENL